MIFKARIKPVTLNKPFPNTARWEGADVEINIAIEEAASAVKRSFIAFAESFCCCGCCCTTRGSFERIY